MILQSTNFTLHQLTNDIGMKQPLDHIHFVTGKLAEHAVREQVEQVAKRVPFEFTIDVLHVVLDGVAPYTISSNITS